MADMTFDDIVRAASKLDPIEKQRLADMLRADTLRDEIIAETAWLRESGAFERAKPLYGKYAKPDTPDVSADEMNDYLRQLGTAWEDELDEFFGDEN